MRVTPQHYQDPVAFAVEIEFADTHQHLPSCTHKLTDRLLLRSPLSPCQDNTPKATTHPKFSSQVHLPATNGHSDGNAQLHLRNWNCRRRPPLSLQSTPVCRRETQQRTNRQINQVIPRVTQQHHVKLLTSHTT